MAGMTTRGVIARFLAGLLFGVAVAGCSPVGPGEGVQPAGEFGCPGYGGMNRLNPATAVMRDVVVMPGFAAVTVGRGDDVNWRLDPFRHRSWTLEFRTMRWLGSAVDAYRRTGDSTYLRHAIGVAKDWVHDNPIGALDPTSIEGTAHRVDFLLCLLDVAGPQEWLLHALDANATVLVHKFSGTYNHGLDEALALFGVGCALGRPADRDLARQRLHDIAPALVDAQGVSNEQATRYHAYVYRVLADADARLRDCGSALPPPLDARYRAMPAFQAQATLPDGTLAPIGDTAVAPAPVYAGTKAEYPATRGESGTAPAARAAAYDAGYAFGRSSWQLDGDTTWYGVRYGVANAVHGHEDHTSVLWWARKRLLLVDSGHVGYEDSWRRDHVRSPEAHNVVVVDGLPFRSVATRMTRRVRRPPGDFVEVRDEPYSGVVRQRSVASFHGFPALVVYDRVDAPATHTVTALWHLSRGMDVKVDGTSARAVAGKGDTALTLVQVPLPGHGVPDRSMVVVAGRRNPPLGWYAPQPRAWYPAPVVTVRRHTRTARMLTVLVATAPAERPRVTMTVEPDGWYRLTIVAGGRTRVARVSPGGYLSL